LKVDPAACIPQIGFYHERARVAKKADRTGWCCFSMEERKPSLSNGATDP
jgi:hypothetical protein